MSAQVDETTCAPECTIIDLCAVTDKSIDALSAEPGFGQGSSASVHPEGEDGGDKEEEDDDGKCCHPVAFIVSLPFLLVGIILWPLGMLCKLMSYIFCCCPGSCICKLFDCLAEIPCTIYKWVKSWICC
eukprot:TRINITY_DN10013_c0_g1_i3.p1 TRINITY_DN10013_c0_g1~~TRINITY_DN10013_c0_g1_i3.p1  ORF type:complete len:129 (-),score=25.08 TRINITY_DN10013_c0_g1_i3:487-873(-)